jgi:ATP/maltotriose-dependent transcriptional regulator MalT
VSKLLRPLVRPGTIRRSLLLGHLENEGSHRIVSVVAPAGYGKTTLLSQWAERSGRACAWVSVDDRDNDPKVLLAYIAEALDAVEAGGRARIRRAGFPGEFSAWLRGAAAGGGVRGKDRADGAGAG